MELFTQVKEEQRDQKQTIDVLDKNFEKFKIELGHFHRNIEEMYTFQKQMINIFLYNVDGKMYKWHYHGGKGEYV